jgi:hypothetical protein
MYTYNEYVKPFSSTFRLVCLENEDLIKIDSFTKKVINTKKSETHHQSDNSSHYKRFFTGMMGEVALEKYLGIGGIADWTIGDSSYYHKPDLKSIGLNIGIKTVEHGLFPVIFKKSYNAEVIMIRWKERHVYICGVATKEVLNTYQSDELIMDSRLRARGTKTGFYGFGDLLDIDLVTKKNNALKR